MNCSGCPFFKPCKEWKGGHDEGRTTTIPAEANGKGDLARC